LFFVIAIAYVALIPDSFFPRSLTAKVFRRFLDRSHWRSGRAAVLGQDVGDHAAASLILVGGADARNPHGHGERDLVGVNSGCLSPPGPNSHRSA
jgi:hypothetical protein